MNASVSNIKEETNHEVNDIDWYVERYDETKQRLEDLQEIKSIIENEKTKKISKTSI